MKRKNETLRGSSLRKIEQIYRVLSNYPEGLPPKMIALYSRLNVNTVKTLLPKMSQVKKKMRGIYKVVNGGDTPLAPDALSDWNFHNLVMTVDGISGSGASFDWGLAKVDLVVSKSGKATLRCSSDFPFNVSSIVLVYGLLVQLVGDVSMRSVYVSTVEFNRDYSNLRLDGVKCITLDSLIAQFKVYQKRRGMRVEHKTKVPMTVENVVDMLTANPAHLDAETRLSELRLTVDRLSRGMEHQTALLRKVIDR